MTKAKLLTAIAFVALPTFAAAEFEISGYTGTQGAPHSPVTMDDDENGGVTSYTFGWEGKPFAMPPYYGFRGTWWRTDNLGFGVEYTHSKVYADADSLAAANYERFELTDGINVLTANATYRWNDKWASGAVTPYVGGGLGFTFPHVDIQADGGATHTWEYQITGAAARLYAGAKYDLSDTWAVFGEYQFTYSKQDIDLDNGGNVQFNLITNALNVGLSYTF
ncbi:outer membrane protein [Marivivens donghaensis]|uniref:outer membrane protein n=1 Tax=Marivivens donghaensis TaxID=1699413 RepID=UPI00201F7158|nr:outer membrane beta-barrel protein [Marivivens donghaensis]MCL7409425.1 porin family protein [Marivivens donghaensis]MDN3702904.1 outer membrane beta-barrel protein [Marivivens donghaensis]